MRRAARPLFRPALFAPLAGLLLVNVVVFVAYTHPRQATERDLQAHLETLRKKVEGDRVTVDKLKERAETLVLNAGDQKRLYSEVLPARRAAQLGTMKRVHEMATEVGLTPRENTYKWTVVKGTPLARVDIGQPLSGNYRQLVSFLYRVERAAEFLTVDAVQLQARSGGEADLTVALSAYFKAEPEDLAEKP